MQRKNPYGYNSKGYNPDDMTENLQDRHSVPDMGEAQELFTVAHDGAAGATDGVAAAAADVLSDTALAELAKQRLCPQCPVAKEAEDARLRAFAEVDNMRKRVLKEKEDAIKYSASNVLNDILPALDNLDLALEHAKNQAACKDFFVGVDMTRKLMLDALGRHGLQQVGDSGEMFDPAVHEAVGVTPSAEVADGAICSILSKGYKLYDRLLRPARVVVCKNN
ncbi:MAG: nucleotide exchange factor GrpE [Deltaproteobacteria bacterium]|jgi:molecular chaperone GrpE|nr:nucleotide exchange factor GrpE [Deltaproteobacteria bacterium]